VIARYHRLAGDDVFFLMGNDEHSQNVAKAAREAGIDPTAYCDELEGEFLKAWAALDVSFDDFIRTTRPSHKATVRDLLDRMNAKGDLYKDKYEGWYCVGCEAFIPEKDLVDGECANHGKKPDWIEEENWFFRLSNYAEALKSHYAAHPEFVRPEKYRNEMLALLDDGLTDVSASRQGTDWGVQFPFDESVVTYVWFDALPNYLSGVGFGSDPEQYARFWPADVHVIGKDITRFHCLLWPAMLMSADIDLPKTVNVHGFITMDGKKLSKSLGTIIDPIEEAADWGADPIRYFLMREMSWGRDGDYSRKRLGERYQHDLGNDLGNLLNRVLNMASKYVGGRVTPPAEPDYENPLLATTERAREKYVNAMEDLDPQGAILAVWEIVTRANGYVDETKPWALVKEEGGAAQVAAVLHDLVEALRHIVVYLYPVMPGRMAAAYEQLGLGDIATVTLADLEEFAFPGGVTLSKGEPLFPRRD
jgi:methionyl-tRNA synthetase